MRLAPAACAFSVLSIAAPTLASAQSVVIEERRSPDVVVREREERVIVREPRARVVVPDTVRRYVVEERRPSVRYERRVVVGDTLPQDVDVYDVPDSDYEYAVINDRRVIVDGDRRVIDEFD